MEWQTV